METVAHYYVTLALSYFYFVFKFRREEDAERAVNDLNNRWFGGRPVYAELSPVTDFREACCRQYEMGECTRSGFCNFMHLKPISRELRRYIYNSILNHGLLILQISLIKMIFWIIYF